MRDEVKVVFQPSGRRVHVLRGTSLLEAAGLAGIILQTPCGGNGTCGKCRVRVLEGACAPHPVTPGLDADALAAGDRLACQGRVQGDLVVEVPEPSLFRSGHRILVEHAREKGKLDPAVRKLCFRLPAPTMEDGRSDRERLQEALSGAAVGPELTRELPAFLRANAWSGTAVLAGGTLMALEPGDTTGALFGVAIDLGTTTVVGTLVNLANGEERGVVSRMNAQISFGDDVVSRIQQVRSRPATLRKMQQAAVSTINEIIGELAAGADVPCERIYEVVVAGNATMQQVLCGYDPSALGEMPFVQVFREAQTLSASDLGVRMNAAGEVHVMPQVGGFVGGDTVGGMLAARLDRGQKPVLLVDIGTNGEMALAHEGRLAVASAAAGPAFEGARIRQGMRACVGAIEKVVVNDDVDVNVIGNARPVGLCGTALIDAVAGLLRKGILDPAGRLLAADELPKGLPETLRRRVMAVDGDAAFILVHGEESATGEPVCLWQKDIRELQLATGAIRAAITILLRREKLDPMALDGVLLAGAFGNFIRRSNARRIGLLPQIPCSRIRFIGNAASLGAKLALLSTEERRYADALSRRAVHVDLSMDTGFQEAFGEAMMFPETDVDGCAGDASDEG